MAQLNPDEVILHAIRGDADVTECLLAIVERDKSRIAISEGPHIDFKQQFSLVSESSVAELARDVLAFSNSDGGIILIGVTDTGDVIGHSAIDPRHLRERLGSYIGTRLDYETANARPVIKGKQVTLPMLLVRRSSTAYPNLLRRDVMLPGRFGRKVKYLRGSLFYREGFETIVEPAGGDINARAVELGFTGASPRTRSSFVLAEDRPGVRLYGHINDRFFGRVNEAADLTSKFEDARGRGISIAGQGGIGKTELAIEIVSRLYKSGRFKNIYSASAKTVLLGPAGAQPTDPVFHDFPSFLRDLLAWLGFDAPAIATVQNLETMCLAELVARKKTLLFIDNLETVLETVDDGRLFDFLDNRVPNTVWLVTTSRVHRIKNWIYSMQLGELESRDAARHLRHELKRHGLQDYASSDIHLLESYAHKLHHHPLAIRWYAWSCKSNPAAWDKGPERIPKVELETFCVGHTLRSLPRFGQKVLAAITATGDQVPLTPKSIEAVSGISGSHLESSLYELECAGLVSALVNDQTGQLTYSIIPLASGPGRDLARKNHWEREFTNNLQTFLGGFAASVPDDPLLRDLIDFDARRIREMPPEERQDLKTRVERANKRQHGFRAELLYLLAECERHSDNIITADDLYREAADLILASGKATESRKYQAILVEAATVARNCSHAEEQIERAIGYLKAIENTNFYSLRILGSLVELNALMGRRDRYSEYLRRVTNLKNKEASRFSQTQMHGLEEALS